MVIILVLIFWHPLSKKIKRISKVEGEGAKYSVLFDLDKEKRSESVPQANETVLTKTDVVKLLSNIQGFSKEVIERDIDFIYGLLLQRAIVTKRQLTELTKSNEIYQTLARIYIQELGRPEDAPLDPVGVAAYGSLLYTYGVNDKVAAGIQNNIRQSPEYRRHIESKN